MRYYHSLIQKIIEKRYKNKKGIDIYMFHQVNSNKKEWIDENVSITKDGFEEFIYELKKQNKTFLSVEDLLNVEIDINKNVVALTFDDIFEDAYQYAFPILRKENIPYCVFLTENYIDKKGFITANEVKELQKDNLCTIGYHTKNHLLMRKLSRKEIEYELDCKEFEMKLDRKISFFAFPYGSVYACTKKSAKISNDSGYKLIFMTIDATYSIDWKNKYNNILPRINVNEKNYKKLLEMSLL